MRRHQAEKIMGEEFSMLIAPTTTHISEVQHPSTKPVTVEPMQQASNFQPEMISFGKNFENFKALTAHEMTGLQKRGLVTETTYDDNWHWMELSDKANFQQYAERLHQQHNSGDNTAFVARQRRLNFRSEYENTAIAAAVASKVQPLIPGHSNVRNYLDVPYITTGVHARNEAQSPEIGENVGQQFADAFINHAHNINASSIVVQDATGPIAEGLKSRGFIPTGAGNPNQLKYSISV